MVIPTTNLFRARTCQDIDDVVHSRAELARLPDTKDAGEEFLGDGCRIVGGAWCNAIIACIASCGGLFAEVGEQSLPATGGGLRIVDHLAQLSPGDLLFLQPGHRFDEVAVFGGIARTEQQ